MKKEQFNMLLIALLTSVVIFTIYSCKKEDIPKELPTLNITMADGNKAPSILTMPSEEGSLSFTLASNSNWDITKKGDNTDWLTVTPSKGTKDGNIEIVVTKNTQTTEREITLSFSVGGKEEFKSIKVLQKPYGPSLFVSQESSEGVSDSGEDITFTIDSNSDTWEYTIDSDVDWITEKQKTSTSLILTVNKNSADERTAGIIFKLTDYSSVTKEVEVKQNAAPLPTLSVSPNKTVLMGYGQRDITFTIDANDDEWEYNLNNTPWLTEKSKTATKLTLKVSENTTGIPRKADLVFNMSSISQKVVISQNDHILAADLLDVVFKEDGTAEDISPSKRNILTLADELTLSTIYSNKFERYIARFDNPRGASNLASGFYKVDYAGDQDFQDALASGHTLEALFMNDLDLTASTSNNFSILSSTQGGGTGLLLNVLAGQSHGITFLTSVNKSDYGWVQTRSSINPEKGAYYHVVGIWNKEKATTYIYVNGELKTTVPTVGHYVHPWETDGNHDVSRWFGIGVDPNKAKGETPLIGDVVSARIYGKALTIEEVEKLWERVKDY